MKVEKKSGSNGAKIMSIRAKLIKLCVMHQSCDCTKHQNIFCQKNYNLLSFAQIDMILVPLDPVFFSTFML